MLKYIKVTTDKFYIKGSCYEYEIECTCDADARFLIGILRTIGTQASENSERDITRGEAQASAPFYNAICAKGIYI